MAQALGFVPTTAGAGGNPSRDSNDGSPVTIAAGNYVTGDQTVDFASSRPAPARSATASGTTSTATA
jgi:hypothetical protein